TQHGMVRNFNGGVYQFNPRTQELNVFCTGTGGNPWGHVFDRWGQSFMVNNPRIMYLSPATGNSGEKIQVKSLISTEKQCGGDIATGTHVGEDIRGQLLSGRFKSRAVIRYEFIENGAGFSANVLPPLLTSKHPNFRPVDVKTGPDGAIYVADWYNSIINHAQHDFRDPRRDHSHGRIWRITHQERSLAEKPKLVGASVKTLVNYLRSPEDWTRHQARKELSERDSNTVLATVEAWVDELDPTLPDYDHHLVEAMWACQNVERVSEKVLRMVLAAKDGNARSAGARILRYWHPELTDPVAMIAKAAADPFPRTRMEAVLSAGYLPKAEAWAAALASLDLPGDPVLDQALPQTTNALEPYWRPAMEAGTLTFASPEHRKYAEQKAGIGFTDRLAKFLSEPSPSPQQIQEVPAELANVGTIREIRMVMGALSRKDSPLSLEASLALLDALQDMHLSHTSKDTTRLLFGLRSLLLQEDPTLISKAAETLGIWQIRRAGRDLTTLLQDRTKSSSARQSAAIALARLGETQHLVALQSLATSGDIDTRYAALPGLAVADLESGVPALIALLTEDPGDTDPLPALLTVLKLRKGASLLSKQLPDVSLDPRVVSQVAKFHRESGQLHRSVAGYFQDAPLSGKSLSAALLAENSAKLTADVVSLGDPHRGEMIYRRKALACMSCHAIGPVGSPIGPNLVAVGAAASPSYMVESILKPNAAIAEHYENRLFTLLDGTVQMGVVTFKSEKEVVLRDSSLQGGKEIRIATSDIQREQSMPSLMPAGLADQLKDRQEFLDLAKFLSELGKPGDFANKETPVIRKWQVASSQSVSASWTTVYSKVDGELPIEDLGNADQVFAKGYLNVQVAGEATLQFHDHSGIRLWIDDQSIDDVNSSLALEPGRRTITVALDRTTRSPEQGLRVEVLTTEGSTLKFQPEGGM
ncbi:MAG: dehydrogenase, partial [Verrucomicrobiota bacterium]